MYRLTLDPQTLAIRWTRGRIGTQLPQLQLNASTDRRTGSRLSDRKDWLPRLGCMEET